MEKKGIELTKAEKSQDELEEDGLLLKTKPTEEKVSRNLFFFTGGIILILSYFSMVSMSTYFSKSYGPQFINKMIFALNFGGLSGFLFYRFTPWRLQISTVIYSFSTIQALSVLLAFCFGESIKTNGSMKDWLGCIPSFFIGGSNSILHSSFAVLLFDFNHGEMSFNNSGLGFAGILSTLVPITQLIFIGSEDYYSQAYYFVGFNLLATVLILLHFYFYFRSKECDVNFQKTIGNVELQKKNSPLLVETLKEIFAILCSVCLGATIAMSILPIGCFGLGMGPKFSKPMGVQLVILAERIMDFAGKSLYYCFPLWKVGWSYSVSLFQIVVLAVATYPLMLGDPESSGMIGNPWLTQTLMLLHGLLVGYSMTGLMHASSFVVEARHKDNSAFLFILFIFIGLLYGSACNLAGLVISE